MAPEPNDFFSELPPLPSGERPLWSFNFKQLLEYVLLPALCALLALLIYRTFARMTWPPPATVLVAGAVTFLIERNGNLAGAIGKAILSTLLALMATWALAAFVGVLEVIDCVGPNGGCFPW